MIVARADVAVTDELALLAPHHLAELGVGLEFDEPKHDLRTRTLKIASPTNVRLFIKARLEFDQTCDRLAGFGRHDQSLDDRAVR